MTDVRGVTTGCGCGDLRGDLHRIDCVVTAASQPHAMVNDDGDVFYPDNPEDIAYFAEYQGARPLDADRFREAVAESLDSADCSTLTIWCGDPAHCAPPYPGALPGVPYPNAPHRSGTAVVLFEKRHDGDRGDGAR